MIATKNEAKKLGRLLRAGNATIQGQCCDGDYWPSGNHYWIVDNMLDQRTYHVRVVDRPTWKRYIKEV